MTVKAYAQNKGIKLIGDLPIFVSYNSADVWSNQDLFLLNEAGNPCFVTGVPPDYFSETGQRWGNPHYNWSHHQATGYQWWISRITHVLKLYDLVRIDHFRGFESCWQIPLESESAVEGRWVAGPGSDFFEALKKPFPNLPFIAEDLGIITDEVLALRKHFHLPGMAILQFAFDSDANNLYLPHNLDKNTVVYTGTHDNDTTLGWYSKLGSKLQDHISNYLSWPNEDQPWPIIKAALASVADTAIIPMQDVLALGTEARMNVPGTVEGNWRWHFEWDQISEELPGYLNKLNRIYGRMNTD